MAGPMLGAVLAGGLEGYAKGSEQNFQAGTQAAFAQWQTEVKGLMEERLAERGIQAKREDADTQYNRELGLKGIDASNTSAAAEKQHGFRMDEIKAGKDPIDTKLKQAQLDKILKDEQIPQAIKTEYASLEKRAEQITAAISKAQAEDTYDMTGENAKDLQRQLNALTKRQQDLIAPYQGDQAPKDKGLPDLSKYRIGGSATKTDSGLIDKFSQVPG